MLGKKKKDNNLQDNETVQVAEAATPVELTQEDQQWLDAQVQATMDYYVKKATKKTAKKMMSKSDKLKILGASVVGAAGSWLVYNFAMRKLIADDLDARLQDKDNIQSMVFDEIANKYSQYVDPQYEVNEYTIKDIAEQLYADGRQSEAEAIVKLLNSLDTGAFRTGDINQFLTNNSLSTVASNMTPSTLETEQALYQAYADVYGFNPQGMTEGEIIKAMIDNNVAPLYPAGTTVEQMVYNFDDLPGTQQNALNKVHEDFMILLNKTDNQHLTNSKQIQESHLDAILSNWPDVDVPDNATFVDKLELVVENMEWEIAGYMGGSDMNMLLSIQMYTDRGGVMDLDMYTSYLDYRVLYENYKQKTDFMSTQDVLNLFGYQGDLLAEYRYMGTNDYIFARVMEDKYDGLVCVKSNGEIDFTDTAGLNTQQIADFQADLANYRSWKADNITQDMLQGVQDLGFLSDSYLDQYAADSVNAMNASPVMLGLTGAAVVAGGAAVMLGYRKWKQHNSQKFIKIWNEEMEKRGLTEEDFVKHHYSFEEVDESEQNSNSVSR